MEKEKLFQDFPPVSDQEWEKQILEDLKGADYEKKLIWNTLEGLKIKPFYRSSDNENLIIKDVKPGFPPFNRGFKRNNNNWYIREDVNAENIEKANKQALQALQKGADTVAFKTVFLSSVDELAVLLKDIDIEKIPVHFYSSESYSILAQLLINYIKKNNIDKTKVKGSFNFDSFGYYLLNGEYYNSLDDNINELACLISLCKKELPCFTVIQINGQHFSAAGADILQELAFSLASAHDYFYRLTEKGIKAEDIAPRIGFTLSSGSAYFMEIAKFRAVKPLWAKIIEQYGLKNELATVKIHAVNNSWNKTILSPFVNMLRTTTEAMAAAIGGCNSMTISPFDFVYSESSDFSNRIARNQQIILKAESYFDKIADPAGGSYYIENITNSLITEAWKMFCDIEEKGGFAKVMEEGLVRNEIEKTAQKRNSEIAARKVSILGSNQYPDINEKMADKISENILKPKGAYLKTYRGALPFELIRYKTELFAQKTGKTPSVFLLTIGNPTMRKARASFSLNFFGCAGFNIIDNNGFKNLDEGVNAALKSASEIIVICSSDEEYKDYAAQAAKMIKAADKNIFVIVAGNPVEIIEELKAAGVDDFINIKTNIIEFLNNYLNKIETVV